MSRCYYFLLESWQSFKGLIRYAVLPHETSESVAAMLSYAFASYAGFDFEYFSCLTKFFKLRLMCGLSVENVSNNKLVVLVIYKIVIKVGWWSSNARAPVLLAPWFGRTEWSWCWPIHVFLGYLFIWCNIDIPIPSV